MNDIIRTERERVFMRFAKDLASLSKCEEKKVAAIIVDEALTQVYSIGVNGGAAGQDDCLCKTPGKYGCVHAEINALIKCRSDAPNKIMFVTLSPCVACAAAIVNAPGGFSKVYYLEGWKNEDGIKLLTKSGIKTEKLG